MPVKRRAPKIRHGLDADAVAWLRDEDRAWEYFEDIETVTRTWRENVDWVVAEWIATSPGTRPPLWWRYNAPEWREPDETETAFLMRHGLLTPAERRRLRHA